MQSRARHHPFKIKAFGFQQKHKSFVSITLPKWQCTWNYPPSTFLKKAARRNIKIWNNKIVINKLLGDNQKDNQMHSNSDQPKMEQHVNEFMHHETLETIKTHQKHNGPHATSKHTRNTTTEHETTKKTIPPQNQTNKNRQTHTHKHTHTHTQTSTHTHTHKNKQTQWNK